MEDSVQFFPINSFIYQYYLISIIISTIKIRIVLIVHFVHHFAPLSPDYATRLLQIYNQSR